MVGAAVAVLDLVAGVTDLKGLNGLFRSGIEDAEKRTFHCSADEIGLMVGKSFLDGEHLRTTLVGDDADAVASLPGKVQAIAVGRHCHLRCRHGNMDGNLLALYGLFRYSLDFTGGENAQ